MNTTESLIWNGTELTSIGGVGSCTVVRKNIETRPNKRATKIIIPGRNGAEYVDEGYFDNVPISYALVFTDFSKADAVINYLLSLKGFFRLEDQYDTDIYRLARVSGVNPRTPNREMGYVEVMFECKPEKYLKPTTEYPAVITITDNSTHDITNPTYFDAKPLIRYYKGTNHVICRSDFQLYDSSSSMWLAKYVYNIDTTGCPALADSTFTVDSDKEDCYFPYVAGANAYIEFVTNEFPLFPANRTTRVSFVAKTGGTRDLTKVEIEPRWYKI